MSVLSSLPGRRSWCLTPAFLFVEDCGAYMYAELLILLKEGRVDEVRAKLQEICNIYYGGEEDEEALSDFEYDEVLKKLGDKKSYQSNVDKNFISSDFPELAGWLGKFSEETIFGWLDSKTYNENKPLFLSPKYDGSAITITYNTKGEVVKAVTRGEGDKGQDCTKLFAAKPHFAPDILKYIKGKEPSIKMKDGLFGVKYECTISFKDLEAINELFEKDYKNPRNAVPGIMRSDKTDPKILEYLTLCPLDISFTNCDLPRLSRLYLLSDIITDNKYTLATKINFEYELANREEDVTNYYNQLCDRRLVNPIMLDGMIIEESDWVFGDDTDEPTHTAALKFPHLVSKSKMIDVEWEEGSSGRLTPVAVFDAVTLGGRTFERASLSSVKRFDSLKLREGTKIILELRNDILMYVTRASLQTESHERYLFEVPKQIEYFTYNTEGERVFAYRKTSVAQNIERMLIKMGIKGIKIERLKAMTDCMMIRTEADIFQLELKHMRRFEGFSGSISDFIFNEIEAAKQKGIEDYKILAGLNIIGIGNTISRQICNLIKIEDILNPEYHASLASGLSDYIGSITAEKFQQGIIEKFSILKEVYQALEHNVKFTTGSIKELNKEHQHTIVVTGDLDFFERGVFKELVESLGHKMVGSVSKKTTMLITNLPNIMTVKLQRAKELGILIVTENQALELLGIEVGQKPETIDNSKPDPTTTGSIFNL